ncbi:hypothetical protein JOB18_007395, partial [Solea senegalensis]
MPLRSSIPVILLAICCLAAAGPLSRSPCELLPVGMTHPVQASLKSFTALSGCASRGTTSLPQEVHIINLRGHAAEAPDRSPAEVFYTVLSQGSTHQSSAYFDNESWAHGRQMRCVCVLNRHGSVSHISEGFESHGFCPLKVLSSGDTKVKPRLHGHPSTYPWLHKRRTRIDLFCSAFTYREEVIIQGENELLLETKRGSRSRKNSYLPWSPPSAFESVFIP